MTEDNVQERHKRLEDAYTELLNMHGFGFQERVQKVARDLYDAGESRWRRVVAEFPVEVQGRGTCIDFILRCRKTDEQLPVYLYLICECKRVNPARGAWCFCRKLSVMHNRPGRSNMIADHVKILSEGRATDLEVMVAHTAFKGDGPYNIGLELKTGEKGDEWEKRRGDAIEDAATQVITGINGYIEHLDKHKLRTVRGEWHQTLIPVVFTTAQLFTSDVELDRADLDTGKVPQAKLRSVQWLVWQYHLSSRLKHIRSPAFLDAFNLEDVLDLEYMRSVCVVSASGVEPFLTKFFPESLDFQRIEPRPPSQLT